MLGRLRFQQRIAMLVALAALAGLTVTAVTLVLGRRSEQQLSGVETRYLPLLELDRDLKAQLAGMTRALENAAAAAEESSLAEADRLRDAFRQRLVAGREHIVANGGDPEALLRELGGYYEQAREVSRALIAGHADEELPARVEAMRAAQARFAARLDASTTPDRARIAAAFAAARKTQRQVLTIDIAVALGVFVLMVLLSWAIIRRTVQSLREVSQGMERLARGDFSQEIVVTTRDEFGDVAREANRTAERLREYREQGVQEDWIKTGVGNLVAEIAGELEPVALGRRALTYLARYVGAPVAAAYAGDEGGTLRLLDLYGAGGGAASTLPASIKPGEGILGQAVRDDEVRVISDVAADYLSIRSALGTMPPRHLLIVPFSHEGRTMGVLELGLLAAPGPQTLELMRRTRGALGIAFRVAESRQRAQALLEETQRQAEELRQTNDELEEQTAALEHQRTAVVRKNDELVATQRQLEEKATELSRASRYKSEFLANMSHELRTPLNSIMILSKILGDDQEHNLSEKQVEFARVIHRSGEELLSLINDVLDLAKVEAGKQELVLEPLPLAELAAYARQMFTPMAQQKHLALEVEVEAGLPEAILTDRTRLAQILKNLVSNAIKFTAHGSVRVRFYRPQPGRSPSFAGLAVAPRDPILISVTDTGIGIPRDKQKWIFEAFAQADGGTSRKYGGTGLGLTIARQLALRLGGDLMVESEAGQGSSFHLLVAAEGPSEAAIAAAAAVRPAPTPGGGSPVVSAAALAAAGASTGTGAGTEAGTGAGTAAGAGAGTGAGTGNGTGASSEAGTGAGTEASSPAPAFPAAVVDDDRDALAPGEPCLLIIEDDRTFAEIVLRLVRDSSFKGLVASDGHAGLELARRHRPSGIILDVGLPDIDGWAVMERLKEDRATRSIPVHFMTACDDSDRARRLGAVGFLVKPADAAQIGSAIRALEHSAGAALRKLLVVERDTIRREALREALTGADLDVEAVATPQQALARLAAESFGCVVLDLLLPDRQSGFDLLARLRHDERTASIPVVVHTGLALSAEEIRSLEDGDQAIVILSGERSMERVLEESRLFLHQVRTRLPAAPRPRAGEALPHVESVLRGKTVLIVDDDMRNVYSLSSALKAKDLHVIAAADGQEALDELQAHPDTHIVLMDVMMPRMDGHEATRRIREQPRFQKLPIIALTAKTMPGERQKCLDAGANDYVPKPVDVDRLLALLRVWLG